MGLRRNVAGAVAVTAVVAVLGPSQAVGAPGPLAMHTDKAVYESLVGAPTTVIDFEDFAPTPTLFYSPVFGTPVSFDREGVTFSDPAFLGFGYLPGIQEGFLQFATPYDNPQNIPPAWPRATMTLPAGVCGVGLNLYSQGSSGDSFLNVSATEALSTIGPVLHSVPNPTPRYWFVGVASENELSRLVFPPAGSFAYVLSVELAGCSGGGGDSAVGSVTAGGGIVSTGSDASASDPVETSVTVPPGSPGEVTIAEGEVGTVTPSGYSLFGQRVEISAPPASVGQPLRLVFTLDSSVGPAGQDETTVQVFRDGQPAGECSGAMTADPDPCVALRERLADGDLRLTVLSSHASGWEFGAHTPFLFQGFEQPVDNPPTVNTVNAGRAIPVKFVVAASGGTAVAARSPGSAPIACGTTDPVDAIEETATAGGSSLSYNAATGRYTYVWKTDKAWAGTCRQLVVKLDDGTTHRANFKFK
jgi:hypothetical protein